MNKKVSEEDILMVFVGVMEARGENRKLVRLDVDIGMLERINRAKGSNIDLEQLHRIAD